jgi:hypothetical protein
MVSDFPLIYKTHYLTHSISIRYMPSSVVRRCEFLIPLKYFLSCARLSSRFLAAKTSLTALSSSVSGGLG